MSGSFQWPGPAKGTQWSWAKADLGNAVLPVGVATVPRVADVAGGPPAVGQPGPLGGVGEGRRVGKAVDDVAPRVPQGLAHLLHVRHIVGIPVVFQVVEAPGGPLPGVVLGERKLAVPPELLVGQLLRPGPAGSSLEPPANLA